MSSTTSRHLRLLSLLQTRRDWPGQLLSERLEVSGRTVRRDIDCLREMGYRIRAIKGPDGGYRMDAGSELPPLLFDDEQAIALSVALQTAVSSGAEIGEGAMRALTTVRQVMPSRLRHRLDKLEVTSIRRRADQATPAVDPDVLVDLSAAVRATEVLHIDYAAPRGSRSKPEIGSPQPPRRVEPHHVVTSRGRWYLVAWDLDRDDWRIFRVDRITYRATGGPRFTPRALPGGDVHTYLAGVFKGNVGVDAWPCKGTVVLNLPAATVEPFAGDGVVEDLGDDGCRLTAGAWSWTALAASLGRFDADITAVEPPELTEACALLARRYSAAANRTVTG